MTEASAEHRGALTVAEHAPAIKAVQTNSKLVSWRRRRRSVKAGKCNFGMSEVSQRLAARNDGCSAPSWKGVTAPFVGTFTHACGKHDICYGTCGCSKATCDRNFLLNMKEACGNAPFYKRPGCDQAADGFYTAVALHGDAQDGYDKGQAFAAGYYCP